MIILPFRFLSYLQHWSLDLRDGMWPERNKLLLKFLIQHNVSVKVTVQCGDIDKREGVKIEQQMSKNRDMNEYLSS